MRRRELVLVLGAAPAFARATLAQQRRAPLIGVLTGVNIGGGGFQQGLREAGFVDGENVAIEYRNALGNYSELPALAADLVHRKVDVIAAFGTTEAHAAKRATNTIPIVFETLDPVLEGLVAGLARPGGNLTGVSLIDAELMPKRVEFLSELVPSAKSLALLVNPSTATAGAVIRNSREAARAKRVQLEVLSGSSADRDIDAAFAAIRRLRAGGLIVDGERSLGIRRDYLINSAARDRVPAIYGGSDIVWAGGLISYGPSLDAARRQMGVYSGRILKGEKPADLPVVQPDRIELLINTRTAKTLGLAVPPALLALADQIVG